MRDTIISLCEKMAFLERLLLDSIHYPDLFDLWLESPEIKSLEELAGTIMQDEVLIGDSLIDLKARLIELAIKRREKQGIAEHKNELQAFRNELRTMLKKDSREDHPAEETYCKILIQPIGWRDREPLLKDFLAQSPHTTRFLNENILYLAPLAIAWQSESLEDKRNRLLPKIRTSSTSERGADSTTPSFFSRLTRPRSVSVSAPSDISSLSALAEAAKTTPRKNSLPSSQEMEDLLLSACSATRPASCK